MKISERLALLKAGYSKEEINAMIDEDTAKVEEPAEQPKAAPVEDYMNVIKALASEVKDLKEAVYSENIRKTEISSASSTKSAEDILAELFSAPPTKED